MDNIDPRIVLDKGEIKAKFKELLKSEKLTWEKLAELEGKTKGSYRANLLSRITKVQSTLSLLGYEIVFKKR